MKGFEGHVPFILQEMRTGAFQNAKPLLKNDGRIHSVKERRKTLGTKKAESSPKKEPPEDLFRSSQVESTSDPGMEYSRLSC